MEEYVMTHLMMSKIARLALSALAAVYLSAPAMAADAAAGKADFDKLCASCHGATGKGDGPTGAAFPTKPRNFADAAWQASVDDARLSKAITGGGAAVGAAPFMPPFPSLKPDQVANLVAVIRGFKP